MSESLCISVTFLDPRFHGKGDGGAPEWPPSPMRLFQAMVAGNGPALGTGNDIDGALRWLEAQPPPTLLTPSSKTGVACPLYVPNNAMDVVAKSWGRGNHESSIAEHRTLKTARPTHLRGGDTVHYLWPIDSTASAAPPIEPLARAVEKMVALGWGIDLVVAQCRVLSSTDSIGSGLEKWEVAKGGGTSVLRCPVFGSLNALMERYSAFLDRLADNTFNPVSPLTAYQAVPYRRSSDPVGQPVECFELRNADDSYCTYPQQKLIHIAGMVRHLAKEAMQQSSPIGVSEDWVERYVVGHRDSNNGNHHQFSYLPLPSIGHMHVDQAVRRVIIAASVGDDMWLEHLAARLSGRQLKPENHNEFGPKGAPYLARIAGDNVTRCYTRAARVWHSVTPVILPGHDDHKPAKTRRLIERALDNAGITQQCEYEWSPQSRFRKSYSAHKYDRHKKATGYLRPDHLASQTAVHLTLRFLNSEPSGPIALGAGRHCGFGLMTNFEPT